jgi:hypothetical protein
MNYTELQTEIANILDRDDLSSDITSFITRCENRLNRKLRLMQMNTLTEQTLSAGTREDDFPSGLLELINILIKPSSSDDTGYTQPIYVAPEFLFKYYSDTSTPTYYTVRDGIELNCEVSSNHTIRYFYIKKWDIATDTTNWLLTNYEDAYIYGSLLQAEAFLKNDERIILWKSLFDETMKELNELDHRSQDDAILETDVYELCSNRDTYSIITDRN